MFDQFQKTFMWILSVDRMSIAASGDGFTSSEDEGSHSSASSILTTLDGGVARGYAGIPQVERAIAVHLCPRNTATWRNRPRLPSKACKTEAFQHILPRRDAPSTAAPGPGLSLPVAVGALLRPPELLLPRPNRHLGWRIEPLAGERCPPHPSQAPSRPGSRRSGPDVGNPEMLEFALSQETARTAPLLPPVEGREENLPFNFVSVQVVPTFSKKEQFPFPLGSQVHGTTVCDALHPHSRP